MRQLAICVLIFCGFAAAGLVGHARAEESLGEKIKRVLNPTPTPAPRKKRKAATAKRSPSPSPSPKAKASATPKETPSPSPSPSVSPEKKASPSPSPKKKKKASPTPTPSASPTPSATPEEEKKETPTPSPTPSASPNETKKERSGGVSIAASEIAGFEHYPEPVRKLIENALALAGRDLSYKYGSADPAEGGMDCSGFIYFILRQNGVSDVPRDSSQQYVWLRKTGKFEAVVSKSDETFELGNLKPGDLLFWTGTYDIERDPPITHTMIYLGKEKSTGRRVMVGASDGRTYHDKSRFGVSVFDFRVSRAGRPATNGRTPDFVGYGKIPGLGEE